MKKPPDRVELVALEPAAENEFAAAVSRRERKADRGRMRLLLSPTPTSLALTRFF